MNKCCVIITTFLIICILFFSMSVNTNRISVHTRETVTNNVRRVENIDEEGLLITDPLTGYATVVQVLDSDFHPVDEHYFDEKGSAVERTGGYYGIRRIYEGDYCIRYIYLDIDNNPVCNSFGYASVKQNYNDEGQVTEVYYLDEMGQPVALTTGQYGEHREYNAEGQNYKSTFINQEGFPVENSKGYSTVIRNYTVDGLVDVEWYYNLAGEKVNIGRNRYGSKMVYNDGVYVTWKPVDANGNVVFNLDTYLQKNPWLIGVIAIVFIIFTMFSPKRLRFLLLVAYIVLIIIMTLFHREYGNGSYNFNLFWSYRQIFKDRNLTVQVLSNIWLFIPLGAVLASIKQKSWVIIIGIGLSICIEITQLIFGLGMCEFDDIISNSLGSWLGFGCLCEGMIIKKRLTNRKRLYMEQ